MTRSNPRAAQPACRCSQSILCHLFYVVGMTKWEVANLRPLARKILLQHAVCSRPPRATALLNLTTALSSHQTPPLLLREVTTKRITLGSQPRKVARKIIATQWSVLPLCPCGQSLRVTGARRVGGVRIRKRRHSSSIPSRGNRNNDATLQLSKRRHSRRLVRVLLAPCALQPL